MPPHQKKKKRLTFVTFHIVSHSIVEEIFYLFAVGNVQQRVTPVAISSARSPLAYVVTRMIGCAKPYVCLFDYLIY
jgi:hypothetical protein